MDSEFFNETAAKRTLTNKTAVKDEQKIKVEHIDKWDRLMAEFQFHKTEQPLKWRLLSKDIKMCSGEEQCQTSESEKEEAVLSMMGYIAKKDLPPFGFNRRNASGAIHRKQYVVLTGLGCDTFEHALTKLQQLDDHFVRQVGATEFDGLHISTHNGHSSIEIMNWLFTAVNKVPGAIHVPFQADEDPNGTMEAVIGDNIVRTDDNIVQYFSNITLDSSTECEGVNQVKPTVFQVGDLVEVGFSVVGSITRGDTTRISLKPIMRYILLVDSTQIQEANDKRRLALRCKGPETKVKRNIGFSVKPSKKPRPSLEYDKGSESDKGLESSKECDNNKDTEGTKNGK